jgi:hypothetical protein
MQQSQPPRCSVIKYLIPGSIMNNFDEWSQIISTYLKSEADLLTTVAKHDIDLDAPREAFIREVLELFLPSSYAIGSGLVVDSRGQSSRKMDLVIYRRDFPLLNLPGGSDRFLYESVLATIEVRPKLVRKTLFDALDACASLSELDPAISEASLANLAEKNGLVRNAKGEYVHEDPLLTARFNLVGRPPSFIYGFNGFKTSFSQLAENIEIWIKERRQANLNIEMKSFPAVIATQGCFGCRNAAPLSAKKNHLFGIGTDAAPIRLIVLNLLYALNRRLRVTTDGYGLRPGLDAYLMQIKPPNIQYTTGRATNAVIRTGAVTAEAIDNIVDDEPAGSVAVDEPVDNMVDEEAASVAVEPDPVEDVVEEPSAEAVFESIPNPNAVKAEATEKESFDPFAELETGTSGVESEFIQTATEEDFVDPLIDTDMVDAAAEVKPVEIVAPEEAPNPFAEMELVDPSTKAADSDEEDFTETVNMMDAVENKEDEFADTAKMTKTDEDDDSNFKTPTSEQDLIATPLAGQEQKLV